MMEWLTVQELVGIGNLPTHPYNVRKRLDSIATEQTKRKRQGTKAFEYHISILPLETQVALYKREGKVLVGDDLIDLPKPTEKSYCREALWARWDVAGIRAQEKAKKLVTSVQAVYQMVQNGVGKVAAYEAVAKHHGISYSTIRRACGKIKDFDSSDWVAVLLERQKETAQARKNDMFAEITPEAWQFFKSDYLRLERPTYSACYLRLQDAAKSKGWTIPSLKSLERRLRHEVDHPQRVLLRQGEHALAMLYPPQIRSVEHMHALEHINGDGYQHNVFVKWFNGDIVRPKTWFWQDVYSRKIIGWRCDLSENKDSIRLSLMDVFSKYGLPKDITIDNTRAAANKEISGGVANRYRFKIKEDDPKGIIPALGINLHWSSVILGKGHGQAKPIERAFGVGGLDEIIDKHPACSGAHTGANPMAKPDNYGSSAVPVEEFMKVIAKGVELYNSKPNRQTEICQGFMSFDEAFNESYANSVIRKATQPQLHMMMLSSEAVRVDKSGCVWLKTGETIKRERNRYEDDALFQHIGEKVLVRFDPQSLHGSVEIYTLESVHICTAICTVKRGFNDRNAARETHKGRERLRKATKAAAKAQDLINGLEVARQMSPLEEEIIPNTKTVEPFRSVAIGNTVARIDVDEELDDDIEATYAENVAYWAEQKRKNSL